MTHPLIRAIELIAVAGTIGSLVYYALCIWSAVAFLRRRRGADKNATQALPVSILKPLKGVDPQMFECLRSHCLQNYPADYEIIFGVNDAGDPAIELVKKLQAEFPSREIRLIVCKENLGSNIKVSNLVQMLPHAGFDLLVVNDSDIQVDPEYLRKVSAPLADADVGLVVLVSRNSVRFAQFPAGIVGYQYGFLRRCASRTAIGGNQFWLGLNAGISPPRSSNHWRI